MKYIPPKFTRLADMAAIDVGRLTEDEARGILEAIRWPKGPVCPHCGSIKITRLNPKSEKVRDGVIQCNDCRGQFTVMVGTIMHRSHITLRQWVQAFYAMCSSKKGVSALQLQRNLGIHTYKAAWHLCHRIRLAMSEGPLADGLKGTVEVDETFVGGRPRQSVINKYYDPKQFCGHGSTKIPVMVLVERNGNAVSKPIERVDSFNLKSAIIENVNENSTIMTDEWQAYKGIGKNFKGGHKVIKHKDKIYVKGDITTNTAESYFALLKRGVHGIFHHVSKRHLNRYCQEFQFRWNHRKLNDGTRAEHAIQGIEGKRLTYKKAVC
ncbi:MAG: IS1595 family transposase [Alphaproteobacteria bacterium]|nr:MAG: IS1595 family transposase [Alphaproteobacteria bacterium]